jgi:CheY-like chemotaxis protein
MSKMILVADDDRHAVALIQGALTRRGHRVTVATDGRAALAAIEESLPDLLLIDLLLPELDGGTLVQQLREQPETAALPVIFLTELVSEQELRRRGPEIGGRFFLAKPFDEDQLWDVIDRVLPAN